MVAAVRIEYQSMCVERYSGSVCFGSGSESVCVMIYSGSVCLDGVHVCIDSGSVTVCWDVFRECVRWE